MADKKENEIIFESYPLTDYQEIEPILCDYYGLNKLELINAIYFAKDFLSNHPEKVSKFDPDNKIYLPLSSWHGNNESSDMGSITFPDFCSKYSIEKHSLLAKALSFVKLFFPIETANDLDTEYWEYVTMVRPEMLKLYIALHGGEKRYNPKCRVTFENRGVNVDTNRPWLQMELERYLDKYLGVKDVKEADRELSVVYYGKLGPKLNKDEARIIWGTYHILQMSDQFKSGGENVVSRLQSRLIADFLICCELREKHTVNEEHIRSRLNSYLKLFDSPEDFLVTTNYKLSPNNDSGRYY